MQEIGLLAISIIINSVLFLFEESLNLGRYYVLFQEDYVIKSFFYFNPLIIFYFLYQTLLCCFFDEDTKKNP